MTRSRPPMLATRLLERLASNRTAVIGDLIEQYRQGRSTSWYWRQVILSIAVTAAKDIGGHKWGAVRSVVTGWTTLALLLFVLGESTEQLRRGGLIDVRLWVDQRVPSPAWWPVTVWFSLACLSGCASGWFVARLDQRHRTAASLSILHRSE